MIAAQMGDTQYRGRIIWMLLTARPDLLPIDLKRQGRAEVHIPLFYPTDESEIRQMFVILAKKLGSRLSLEDVPPIPQRGHLSGADIEGMVGRAWRDVAAGRRRSRHARGAGRGGRAVHAVDAGARARAAGDRGDPRVHRPAVPAAGDSREDRRPRAAARKLQARLTALKQMVKELVEEVPDGTNKLVRRQGGASR